MTNSEKQRRYRLQMKVRDNQRATSAEAEICGINSIYIPPPPHHVTSPHIECEQRFVLNRFGFSCDHLWFGNYLLAVSSVVLDLLRLEYPIDNASSFRMCNNFYQYLCTNKSLRLSRSNGFSYPPLPLHLAPLEPITEWLVSPRLPFIQIRRLSFVCS